MVTKIYFIRHVEPNYENHDDMLRELSSKGMDRRFQLILSKAMGRLQL